VPKTVQVLTVIMIIIVMVIIIILIIVVMMFLLLIRCNVVQDMAKNNSAPNI